MFAFSAISIFVRPQLNHKYFKLLALALRRRIQGCRVRIGLQVSLSCHPSNGLIVVTLSFEAGPAHYFLDLKELLGGELSCFWVGGLGVVRDEYLIRIVVLPRVVLIISILLERAHVVNINGPVI